MRVVDTVGNLGERGRRVLGRVARPCRKGFEPPEAGRSVLPETERLATMIWLGDRSQVLRISKSAGNFREDIEAIDASGHPELFLAVFDPHDRGLAAGPLLFTETEFCRKD